MPIPSSHVLALASSLALGSLCIGALCIGSLPAQGFYVAPDGYATREGAHNNFYPWGLASARYQQIHTNLPQRTLVLFGLAWRRDGSFPRSSLGVRDLEITIAESSYAARSATFASNYAAPATVVFTRKMVNMVDWSTPISVNPAPFDFAIMFDAPVPFDGTKDFLWEMVQHSSTVSAAIADALNGSTLGNAGHVLVAGSGCKTAASSTEPMRLTGDLVVDASGQSTLSLACYWAPPSAAGVLLLGLSNPALTLPGLCAPLQSDGVITVPAPTSATDGAWLSPVFQLGYLSTLTGQRIWAQAAAADATQPGIPLAVSNGLGLQIPPGGSGGTLCRIYNTTSATAVSGTVGSDYGLVTKIIGL